ncbi:MAG: hypothetical protein WC375_03620, partial [Methanomassiliicoccales archaeon]
MAINLIYDAEIPSGWKEWVAIQPLYYGDTKPPLVFPDVALPHGYFPSPTYWLRTLTSHCGVIPWITNSPSSIIDPFSTFMLAGGGSGSLIGSIGGMAAVSMQLSTGSSIGSSNDYGYGMKSGPRLGYCFGTLVKEAYYIRIKQDASCFTELYQLSKFTRMYAYQGEITRYYVVQDKHYVGLGITGKPFVKDVSVTGEKISTTRRDGSGTDSFRVVSVLPNWDVEIDPPQNKAPQAGDFYQLGSVWLLADPYLLSGEFYGTETTNISTNRPTSNSGLDLFISSHNSPFENGKVLGIYVLKNIKTNDVLAGNAGMSMDDSGGYTWAFAGFGVSSTTEPIWDRIYNDDKRYPEVYGPREDDGTTTTT